MGTTSTSTAATSALPQSSALYTSAINKITNAGNQPFHPYQTAGYNNTGGGEFVAPVNAQQMAGIGGLNYYANAAQPYLGAAANWTANAGAPLTAAGIQRYYSPYMQNVAQSTEALLNQQNQQAMAGQLGNAINSGAFGGDRAGIAAANLNQQNLLAGANIYSGLENTGYNNALAAAQMQQQLGLAGAGQLAGIGQNIQLAGLQGAQSQIAGGTLMQQTQQASDTALAAQYAQQRSYPFQVAQQYLEASGMLGPLYGSTSSQTQPGALFSDARMKENLKKVGETFDRQPIYSYNYKGDNHTQIGLIAQDVEHHHPEAVGLAGGMKTVNYDKATAQAANRGHFYSGGLVASSMGGHVGPEHERQGYATSGSVTAAELAPYLNQLNWGDFIRAHAAGLAGNMGGGGGGGGILGAGPYGQPLKSSGMQSRPLTSNVQFNKPTSLGEVVKGLNETISGGKNLLTTGENVSDWVNDNLINPQPDVTTKAKDPTRQAGVGEAHGGLVGRPHHATQGTVSNGDPLDLSADQNLVANSDYQNGNNINWTIPNSSDKSAGIPYATFPKTDSVASSLGSLLGGGSALLNTLGLGKGQGYATKGLNQDVLNQIDQTASNGIPLPNQPYVDPTTPQDYNTASQSASDYYGQPGWMDSPSNNPSSDTSSSTDTSSKSSTSFAMGGAAVLRHRKSNQANPSSKPHIAMPTFSNAGLGGGRSESERGKPHKAAGGAMVARHGYAEAGTVPSSAPSPLTDEENSRFNTLDKIRRDAETITVPVTGITGEYAPSFDSVSPRNDPSYDTLISQTDNEYNDLKNRKNAYSNYSSNNAKTRHDELVANERARQYNMSPAFPSVTPKIAVSGAPLPPGQSPSNIPTYDPSKQMGASYFTDDVPKSVMPVVLKKAAAPKTAGLGAANSVTAAPPVTTGPVAPTAVAEESAPSPPPSAGLAEGSQSPVNNPQNSLLLNAISNEPQPTTTANPSFMSKALSAAKNAVGSTAEAVGKPSFREAAFPIAKALLAAKLAPTASRGAALAFGATTGLDAYNAQQNQEAKLAQTQTVTNMYGTKNAGEALANIPKSIFYVDGPNGKVAIVTLNNGIQMPYYKWIDAYKNDPNGIPPIAGVPQAIGALNGELTPVAKIPKSNVPTDKISGPMAAAAGRTTVGQIAPTQPAMQNINQDSLSNMETGGISNEVRTTLRNKIASEAHTAALNGTNLTNLAAAISNISEGSALQGNSLSPFIESAELNANAILNAVGAPADLRFNETDLTSSIFKKKLLAANQFLMASEAGQTSLAALQQAAVAAPDKGIPLSVSRELAANMIIAKQKAIDAYSYEQQAYTNARVKQGYNPDTALAQFRNDKNEQYALDREKIIQLMKRKGLIAEMLQGKVSRAAVEKSLNAPGITRYFYNQ